MAALEVLALAIMRHFSHLQRPPLHPLHLAAHLGHLLGLGEEAPAQVLRHDVEAVLRLLQLGVELVVLAPGGLLGPEDVEDLLVLWGAGRAVPGQRDIQALLSIIDYFPAWK